MKNPNHDNMITELLTQGEAVLSLAAIAEAAFGSADQASLKAAERALASNGLMFPVIEVKELADEHSRPAKSLVVTQAAERARKKRQLVVFASTTELNGTQFLAYNDARGGRRWLALGGNSASHLEAALEKVAMFESRDVLFIPTGLATIQCRDITRRLRCNTLHTTSGHCIRIGLEVYSHGRGDIAHTANMQHRPTPSVHMTHLDRLEAESMHIIREVMAEADNPVMLYSVGKDSSVMLHLARKAFYPSPPPFPLLHVDTRWKFQAMYDFRDYMAEESGMELLVHINPEGVTKNINPLDHGSAIHTDIMKTQSLKQALDHYKFDVAFGGARRDEEKSRAKERVFSFRTPSHRWDPKNQRPELWNLYNGKKNPGESIRVFPISNWTELDIWQYIYREQIPIVPLYFAAERPVVERDGMLLMVDDDRLNVTPDEEIMIKKIRFRTLGCYPLTGAIESEADDLASIVLELLAAKTSERQGRAIDTDSSASMEKKKQEGYF